MKNVDEIVKLIEPHYKRSRVHSINLDDDYLTLKCTLDRAGQHPYVALRILNANPKIRVVHFTGGYVEGVYTRNTLSYAGYKVKENKGE